MKKIEKRLIDQFGENSVASVVKKGNTYAIRRDKDGLILATGKELKGYRGDIIRTMYHSFIFSEGKKLPYILMSDRHGIICKIK